MLFSSMVFVWIFLPIVFFGNFILQKLFSKRFGNRPANAWLLLGSLFFYAWGEPIYVFLMLASITLNWLSGLVLVKVPFKKTVVFVSVALNLALLGYFKYAGMLVSTVNALMHREFTVPEISLPIGISFFTFQALSYVIDVYRGEAEVQKNWFKLALYVSFFPQLIAGPIVKYKDVNDRIDNRTISLTQTAAGIRRFIYGFSKKVLIANVMGLCADTLYGMNIGEMTGLMVWIASISYTLQIYFDFSGYSDMAIGLGKMFGFEFKENFNYPYRSHSIREFWRRWHISLSSWFRDYVYIPLGGNRKGQVRTYINLFIVFFLTGIWHGASWTFVFWGIYHGIFCIIERLGLEKLLKKSKILSWIYTIFVVNIGWVFFRVDSIKAGFSYVRMMLMPWKYTASPVAIQEMVTNKMFAMIVLGILGSGIVKWIGEKTKLDEKWRYSYLEIIFCALMFLLSICSLAGDTYNPFIYFRF